MLFVEPVGKVPRRDVFGREALVEGRKPVCHPGQMIRAQPVLRDHGFEVAILGKTAHHHQPVHDRSSTVEREPTVAPFGQRAGIVVDVPAPAAG